MWKLVMECDKELGPWLATAAQLSAYQGVPVAFVSDLHVLLLKAKVLHIVCSQISHLLKALILHGFLPKDGTLYFTPLFSTFLLLPIFLGVKHKRKVFLLFFLALIIS